MSKYRNQYVLNRMDSYKVNRNLKYANFREWSISIDKGEKPIRAWRG